MTTAVAVMGAGSWGTAFGSICADTGAEVRLWTRRPEVADTINAGLGNPEYLPDIGLNEALRATPDPEEALAGADIVVLAVPSHALVDSLAAWRALVPRDAVAVSLVKGIALDTGRWASEVIRDAWGLPDERAVVASGPNLARECAQRFPSGTVVAGPDEAICARVQAICHTPWFRVYTNPDRTGVEVGGAVKNAIALAAGMADGMGYGENTKAMLLTRGLAEMTRLGLALGGRAMTFAGLAGMGDLVATCTSTQSRNRHVGEQLGRGRPLATIIDEMNMVAEGVKSSPAIARIARDHDVEMPIVEHVVRVLHDGLDPQDMAVALMGRSPKSEFHGMEEARG